MSKEVRFYCLRCGHRFPHPYDSKVVRERACPQCGSNSVRRETPAARAAASQPVEAPAST